MTTLDLAPPDVPGEDVAAFRTDGAAATAAALVPRIAAEAAEVDVEDGFPRVALALLRDAGLLAAPLSLAAPSPGADPARQRLDLFETLAHLGRGSLPVGRIYEGHVNALLLIAAYGSAAQAARASVDARRGHLFGVWNTEAADGVVVRRTGAGLALRGSKTFATGTGFVTRALVTANDDDGARQMLLVATDATPPRIDRSFWRPLGMRATASYKADFCGIVLAADALIGAPGDYYREPMFSSGATRFAAVQLGGAEAVLDATRVFLRELGRRDDPYQRARLGEMAMLVAGGRHWLRAAATEAPAAMGELPPAANAATAAAGGAGVAFAHLMRSALDDLCLRTLQLAERSVGARGLLQPAPFERLHRDLVHYLRQGAPDAAIAAAGAFVLSREEPFHSLWARDDARR